MCDGKSRISLFLTDYRSAQVILYNIFEDYGRLWQAACSAILNPLESEGYPGPELPPIICHEVSLTTMT